ncbi:MAG: carbohydrate ABC transporter permease [Chloroflexota bacterium]|nr:carbohydrate ABC transporter permease [Chloroflexota bacterium]MDE2952716.1 carbohydrate ABC transporter permease [Chloroflexota bacterium]
MSRSRRESAILYAVVIVVIVILVFPLYWMFNTSLAPATRLRSFPPVFVQPEPTLAAYQSIFAERPIGVWLRNSAVVALSSTALSMFVSVLAGYSISRIRARGSQAIGLFFLMSRMLPSTLIIIPLFVSFRQLQLIGDLKSLVLAHATFITPFAVWMLKGYFDTIPAELEDAAMIDGCTPLSALVRVVLPLSAPGLAATTLYGFVLSWNDFVFARTFLVANQNAWTVNVGVASLKGEYLTEWNEIMAGSLIAMLPIVIAYLFLERFLVSGLTAGSSK